MRNRFHGLFFFLLFHLRANIPKGIFVFRSCVRLAYLFLRGSSIVHHVALDALTFRRLLNQMNKTTQTVL
jgi:hypothetical protein